MLAFWPFVMELRCIARCIVCLSPVLGRILSSICSQSQCISWWICLELFGTCSSSLGHFYSTISSWYCGRFSAIPWARHWRKVWNVGRWSFVGRILSPISCITLVKVSVAVLGSDSICCSIQTSRSFFSCLFQILQSMITEQLLVGEFQTSILLQYTTKYWLTLLTVSDAICSHLQNWSCCLPPGVLVAITFVHTPGRLKAPLSLFSIPPCLLIHMASLTQHWYLSVSLSIILVLSQWITWLVMHAWSVKADFLMSLSDAFLLFWV